MSRILLQTTIVDTPDDWTVDRFSLLADELRFAGHHVIARNRDEAEDDSILGHLDHAGFDQLWLMAVDGGDGLSPEDAAGILRFRSRGGGVLTARDHQDLGSSVVRLGTLGRVNRFHHRNPDPNGRRDDRDNPGISWPNHHSGANGDYQPIFTKEPAHELLRTALTESGHIEWFPAHPHEGEVWVPDGLDVAEVIARGRSIVTGRWFNLAVAVDGEIAPDGRPMGRALACSTFHHFANMNWNRYASAPSFVTDEPGDEMSRDPFRFQIFKDYVANISRWLGVGPGPPAPARHI